MKLHTRELTGTELLIAYYMADGNRFQIGAPDGELRQDDLTEPDCKYGPWMLGPKYNTCLTCDHLALPRLEELMVNKGVDKVFRNVGGTWSAHLKYRVPYYSPTYDADIGATATARGAGDNPLTAAMCSFVARWLGDEFEIDDKILEVLK